MLQDRNWFGKNTITFKRDISKIKLSIQKINHAYKQKYIDGSALPSTGRYIF